MIYFIAACTFVIVLFTIWQIIKSEKEETIQLTRADIKELSRNNFFDQDFFCKN